MKIVVLAGGLSPERDVSLTSGSLIANSLIQTGNRVILVDLCESIEISKEEFDSLYIDKSHGKTFSYAVKEVEPNLEEIRQKFNLGNAKIGRGILSICQDADIVFLALHGDIGENGKIQALLDIYGIKYTGSSSKSSMVAMDKVLAKNVMSQAGIRVPQTIDTTKVTFPCVVKPMDLGSSIGVSIVKNKEELKDAMERALQYGDYFIEPFIKGREIQVAILDGKALPSIEILPTGGFYDYKNKYQKGVAREITPAPISPEREQEVRELALRVHTSLQLGSYSRIDFILDENNEFICLEANTLPGMTPTSLLPQEAKVVGIEFDDLVLTIANLAKEKDYE